MSNTIDLAAGDVLWMRILQDVLNGNVTITLTLGDEPPVDYLSHIHQSGKPQQMLGEYVIEESTNGEALAIQPSFAFRPLRLDFGPAPLARRYVLLTTRGDSPVEKRRTAQGAAGMRFDPHPDGTSILTVDQPGDLERPRKKEQPSSHSREGEASSAPLPSPEDIEASSLGTPVSLVKDAQAAPAPPGPSARNEAQPPGDMPDPATLFSDIEEQRERADVDRSVSVFYDPESVKKAENLISEAMARLDEAEKLIAGLVEARRSRNAQIEAQVLPGARR